jgi:hypothetical protein
MPQLDLSTFRETRWYEYAARSFFGGLITAVAGIIAKKFGPAIGGLFLAFPAIFPAAATLIEKHVKEKKERSGLHGSIACPGSRQRRCRRSGDRKPGLDGVRDARLAARTCPQTLPCTCRLSFSVVCAGGWRVGSSQVATSFVSSFPDIQVHAYGALARGGMVQNHGYD